MSEFADIPFHGSKLAILTEEGILLIQRDNIPSIPWPDYWDLPGGAREQAETPLDCVLRETKEELGICVLQDRISWGGCWVSPPAMSGFLSLNGPNLTDLRSSLEMRDKDMLSRPSTGI